MRFSSFIEWLFFLILPVIFTVILAGGTGASSDNRVRLVVVDQAQTHLSSELISLLGSSESVRPDLKTLEDGEYQFDARQVSALLLIPASFNQSALENGSLTLELRQQPNNLNALVAQRTVQAVISRVGQEVEIARRSVAEAEKIQAFQSTAERQSY